MKKVLLVVLAICLVLVGFAACKKAEVTETPASEAPAQTQEQAEAPAPETTEATAEEPAPAEEEYIMPAEDYEIGYVQGGSDAYYQMQADAAQFTCDKLGVTLNIINAEMKPEKELAAVETFIQQGVDAIVVFTASAETSQIGAQKANEANIPYFIVGSEAAEGPGVVTSTIKGNFVTGGAMLGKFVAENLPGSKCAIVEGALGQGIAEPFEEGFEGALDAGSSVVLKAPGDWNAEKSEEVVNGWMASYKDGDFDVIYAMNADIYIGTVKALESAGKLNNPIKVITHNGREEDLDGVAQGKALVTLANSPTYEAGIMLRIVISALNGEQIPKIVETPFVMVTKDNLDDAFGWAVESSWKGYVSGTYTAVE